MYAFPNRSFQPFNNTEITFPDTQQKLCKFPSCSPRRASNKRGEERGEWRKKTTDLDAIAKSMEEHNRFRVVADEKWKRTNTTMEFIKLQ